MASTFSEFVKLNSGASIPSIALGVYKMSSGVEAKNAALSALQIGYRHIDTAQFYENEKDIGAAVRESSVPREDLFITTKIWISNFGYHECLKSLRESSDNLGVGTIDLVLLHAPGDDPQARQEAWRALEDAVDSKLVRSIGVSNFGVGHLEKLLQHCRVRPAVNQIELHPWLQRRELVDYCRREGIVIEAYSPLAKAAKLSDPALKQLADDLSATPAEVLVAWSLQKGFVCLPKSVHPERQRTNLHAGRLLPLPDHVMEALDGFEAGLVTGWDPITQHKV